MGIHGLTKLLSDEAPNCMKEVDLDSLTGRKVAVDASMAMYQFLVRRQYGGIGRCCSSQCLKFRVLWNVLYVLCLMSIF